MKKILIASSNKLKIEWFKEALSFTGLEIVTLGDINYKMKTEEDGNSFEINAVAKVLELVMTFPSYIVVSDDGGIIFDGIPDIGGLYTNRHRGDLCKDVLLRLGANRKCHFEGACAIAWSESSTVRFKTIICRSFVNMEVASLRPEQIQDNANVYEIIDCIYDDNTKIRINDMPPLLKMYSVGVLDPYFRLAYFIKNTLSRIIF